MAMSCLDVAPVLSIHCHQTPGPSTTPSRSPKRRLRRPCQLGKDDRAFRLVAAGLPLQIVYPDSAKNRRIFSFHSLERAPSAGLQGLLANHRVGRSVGRSDMHPV